MVDDNLLRIFRHIINTYCPIEYKDKIKARIMLDEYERYNQPPQRNAGDE